MRDVCAVVVAVMGKAEDCRGKTWPMASTEKPHGRLGWAIYPGPTGGPYLDVSVMPRVEPAPPPAPKKGRRA